MRERGKRACRPTVVNDDGDDGNARCVAHACLAGKKQARALACAYLLALAQTFLGVFRGDEADGCGSRARVAMAGRATQDSPSERAGVRAF